MTADARQILEAEFQEFHKTCFPKLGYTVEDLPETDSVLGGLVTQVLSRSRKVVISEEPIISTELAQKVADARKVHQGSEAALRLEAYLEKMKKLEAHLHVVSAQNKG